ncbi:hypothetical protein ACROYT_G013655 [Oculina patagonica]
MDDSLYDQVFSGPVNIADTPWSVDNFLFEENLKSDSDNDIADLFNGGWMDEGFDEEDTISNPGTPRNIEEISDEEIKNLRVQQLNKLLRGMPRDEAAKIRRKRRNLKNRDYALTCRMRRQQFQEDLFNENQILKRQLADDKEKLRKVLKERNIYKGKLLQLQSACKKEFIMQHFVPPNLPLEAGSLA